MARSKRFIVLFSILGLGCSLFTLPWGTSSTALCADASLAEQEAFPGDRVLIEGLDPQQSELYGELQSESGGEPIPLPIAATNDGGYELITPLHPANPLQGGEVTIALMADSARCGTVTLEIQPLPQASGTFDRYYESIGNQVRTSLTDAGLSEQSLSDLAPEQVDRYFPLLLAWHLTEDPTNPNSLAKVSNGTAAAVNLSPAEFELLDALTAQLGLNESFTARQQRGTLAAPVHQEGGFATARELSDAMQEQYDCEKRLTGATGQLLQDAGLAIAGIGAVNSGVGAALGVALVAHQLPTEYCANRLPAEITEISIHASETSFPEDYEGGPNSFSVVEFNAQSRAWSPTQLLIDVALSMGGALDTVAELGAASAKGFSTAFIQDLNAMMASLVNGLCGRSSSCREAVSTTLPPVQYTGIKILSADPSEFVKGDILPAPDLAFTMTGEAYNEFKLIDVGTSELTFETVSGEFGPRTYQDGLPATVHPIDVSILPGGFEQVKPGETVCFQGQVEHAIDKGLDWYAEGPEYPRRLEGHSDGTGTGDDYCFRAPDWEMDPLDPEDSCEQLSETRVYSIEARSTSEGGLRAKDPEPRLDIVPVAVVKEPDENSPPPPQCSVELEPCHWRARVGGLYGGSYEGDNARFFEPPGLLNALADWGFALSQTDQSSDRAELQLYSGGQIQWIFSPDGSFEAGVVGDGQVNVFRENEEEILASFSAPMWQDAEDKLRGEPPASTVSGLMWACPGAEVPDVLPDVPGLEGLPDAMETAQP